MLFRMGKVLLIEDDILIQRAVAAKLKKEGFEIIGCSDGKEGLEKLATELPDLVLTDVMLPYVSGLEIVNAVKSLTEKSIKVIVFSTMGQEKIVQEAFDLGADDYITKPFSLNELSIRVKKQLTR
jgi:Response regulators consisting of a CheY-like receiver domain and a winged-helix DNA-binding domain